MRAMLDADLPCSPSAPLVLRNTAEARRPTGSQQGHQRLSLLVDINRACGRRTIGFGLFPYEVREFKGYAPFRQVPESWEF
jgi:hypothetical protein